ncbi:aminotransferase class I/II-fold pyridoxal phosphate-dependent enzyme [Maribacter sp.]|uniref:DegT/DnrJ/EryC1/StrS family aminotransferase n=1 Tax=Maribacter sp. TaxID=1897614 RepID=UPI0025C4B034|nr:aminotransferase class I/II-fold pyridoxal phosphate-dependent enzyme [Maribacter sp.]
MGGTEQNYINSAFEQNWIAPLGPNVDGFESDISEFLGEESKVAVLSSGTAAIHLGLKLLTVESGDEVICQSFTFSASANPIAYLGARPVFVDSERDTWNICPIQLEKAILDRIANGVKPKAIIAVHLYGMPYKVKEIQAISEKYDIPVLEDSAEALGSTVNGVKCGTFGDVGVLSFNGNKIITTSGGGALISKNQKIKEKAIFLATQARDNAIHYQHSEIGHNYRMSNILAGIGRGQMEVLQDRVDARRNNYAIYKKELSPFKELEFSEDIPGYYSNHWLTAVLVSSYEIREKIRLALLKENVESRPLWKPMHMQPVFRNSMCYTNGVSEDLFNRGLCLPSGSNLSKEDLFRVIELIKKEIV